MNAKQKRKAKRHFNRICEPKLMELRLLGASPQIVSHHRSIASMPFLDQNINHYRGRIK